MRTLDVGVDLDGVGYVFGESVRMYLASIGRDVPPMTDDLCKSWNFYDQWGMDRDEFAAICDAGVDAGYVFGTHEGLTRPNFFEAIKEVKEMGHKVIVVTHRWQGTPGNAEKNTHAWLAPVREYIDEIHFNGDKTLVKTDIFVEDNLQNYDKLVAAGTKGVLINRPWNAPYDDDRVRINDIKEFPALVDILSHFEPSMV